MAYRDEVLAETPGSYLRLGEPSGTNANDEQGFNLDGTYVNSPTLGVTGALVGDSNTAITVASASSQRVDWSTLTTLGSSLASATFEAWVKTTSTSPGSVFGVVNTGTTMIVALHLNMSGSGGVQSTSVGDTLFYVRSNGGSSHLNAAVTAANATVNLYDGNWHHVVVRVEAISPTSSVTMFFDGRSQTVTYPNQAALTVANFGFPLMLGARNVRGTADRYMDGSLDEVAVYNFRLSDARVKLHYWAGVLRATSAGTSTSAGNLTETLALAASSPGTSTSTSAATVAWALAATSAGTSTSTGAAGLALPLAATSTGSSTTAGALSNIVQVAGTSAGSSTTTGAVTVGWALAGSSAGTSTSAGAVVLSAALAGSSAGSSTTTGGLTVQLALEALSGGTGIDSGDLSVLVPTNPIVVLGDRRTATLAKAGPTTGVFERPATLAALTQATDRSALIIGSTPEPDTIFAQAATAVTFTDSGRRLATITSER